MKYTITLSLLFSISTFLSAQIAEKEYSTSRGMQPAFVMDHEGADKKMVFKYLEDYYGKFGNVERNKKANEWVCMDCRIPAISVTPVNVYFKVKEHKGTTTSYHFFDNGTGFISRSTDPQAREAANTFLEGIDNDMKRKVLTEVLEKEADKLKGLNKDLKHLQDKNQHLVDDIEKYQDKIRQAEEDIEKNVENQEEKQREIEKQSQVVQEITDKLNSVGR